MPDTCYLSVDLDLIWWSKQEYAPSPKEPPLVDQLFFYQLFRKLHSILDTSNRLFRIMILCGHKLLCYCML